MENVAIAGGAAGGRNGSKRSTPYDLLRVKNTDPTVIFGKMIEYNQSLSSQPSCLNRLRAKPRRLTCKCLRVLNEDEGGLFCEAVAEYQMYFGRKTNCEQQHIVIEWMRLSMAFQRGARDRRFCIPFLRTAPGAATAAASDDPFAALQEALCCPSSILDILGKGKTFWNTCHSHSITNTFPFHKLTGQPSNKKRMWDSLYEDSLILHMEELRKESGPIATRFVREETGEVTTRDDNDKSEYLSPAWSKRQCYASYCRSRGVIITTNNKGTITKTLLPSAAAGDGVIPSVPSWSSYEAFWQRQYPFLKVSRPAEDICSYCYVFHNKHKARVRSSYHGLLSAFTAREADKNLAAATTATTAEGQQSSSEQDALPTTNTDEQRDDNNLLLLDDDDDKGNDDPPERRDVEEEEADVSAETIAREKAILDAGEHVKMAQAQRQLVNRKIAAAKAGRDHHHIERTYTLIVDYGQNMALPFFGESQPQDTYYYTPLNVYNLGVVDVSQDDHLYCHIYKDGDGTKGGVNIASLLMKSLNKLGIIDDRQSPPTPGKELNVVFDNCSGQNKNNTVLALVPMLMEMGHFKCVNFLFLVVGHTKNTADRRFNNLKMIYRNKNIYTLKQLRQICATSPHVTVWEVMDGDFYDYKTFLKDFYLPYTPLLKMHIFSCMFNDDQGDILYSDDCNTLMVSTRRSDLQDHEPVIYNLIKANFYMQDEYPTKEEAVVARRDLLLSYPLLPLPSKGIPHFKQVQLYSNYRKFLPAWAKDITCPKPSDEVLKGQKEDQKSRLEAKKKAKIEAGSKLHGRD